MKNSLNYSYFTGALLFAFVRSLLKIVDSTKLSDGLLKTLLSKVETVFADFSKGLERESGDPLSAEAAEKDAARDACFSGMKNYIKSFTNNPAKSKSEAAEKLTLLIRKYGWGAERMSYNEETTAISKCIEKMNGNYAAEVAELGLQELWLNPLIEAQEAFDAIQNQRVANGATEMASMSQYRGPLVKALRTFLESLETFADNTNEEAIKTYAAEIDELIGQTMSRIKAANSRGSNNTPPVTEGGSSQTAG